MELISTPYFTISCTNGLEISKSFSRNGCDSIRLPIFLLNRNAIAVKPQKPFFDWVTYLDPEPPVIEKEEATIYLVRERDSNEQIGNWLKRNFDKIFQMIFPVLA